MAWFRGNKGYDRTRILEAARKAARKRNHARAIAEYERVAKVEPNNVDVLRKLASQRARAGQRAEAWRDYQRAGEVLSGRGFIDQAIGVYRDAATRLPEEVEVWQTLASLELERNRKADAVTALLEGSRCFRSRSTLRQAVSLLYRARKIDPRHFQANFELARLLARARAHDRARRILDELAATAVGRNLRRVRARLFFLSPTPAAAWRWLAAFAS